jgi:hypothetical protein
MGGETATVGPGLGAFIAFFCLAIALWLLMRNMSARMRRMAYRERERIAALEEQDVAESPSPERRRDAAGGGQPSGEVADDG